MLGSLKPDAVFAEVVEEKARLSFEGPKSRQALDLTSMKASVGDGRPQPDPAPGTRLDPDLVDRETQVVESADPSSHRIAVARADLDLRVELVPQASIAFAGRFGGRECVVHEVLATLHRREIGEAEGNVLDEDLEVVRPLSVGERRVQLARLGIDEVGLNLVAVAPEERVREGAVAPIDTAAMQIHEQSGHGVEQLVTKVSGAWLDP